ncbi:hypothetical protein [Vibrio algicola]|uniref:hypothetical protein n=1 Tax=Vibrio algicola TaxID=2662262 RepID=UPI001CECA7F4|nr:hypothetical protein [Vibrio algicola]
MRDNYGTIIPLFEQAKYSILWILTAHFLALSPDVCQGSVSYATSPLMITVI